MANVPAQQLGYQSTSPPIERQWPWWRRRITILAIGVLLWLGLVFAYTSPSWEMTVYRLIVDGGVSLLWLASAAGLGSVLLPLLGAMDAKADKGVLRFVTSAAIGLGAFSLTLLALSLLGWLNQATAIGVIALGLILGISRLFKSGWTHQPHSNWLADRAGWACLLLLVVPFISIMTAGSFLPPYLLWSPNEPHGYDVVEYHLQVPREWYEAGRMIPLHHNVFSYFPFNVEMHYLLAMHLRGGPWAGMYLAQLMHGEMILLAVLAACGFAYRLAPDGLTSTEKLSKRAAPVLAAVAMLTTPWLAQLGAIAYDEGGFLLFGTLALGWAVRALRDPERRLGRFTLAGVMAGFACGCKLTAVPEVLVAIGVVSLVLLLVTPTHSSQPIARRLAGPAVFGAAALLCLSPWLIRTWAWSGNPVFPELPSVLGRGHFSEVQIERWHRAHTPQPAQRSALARVKALWKEVFLNWQYGYLLVPLGLLSIALNWRQPDIWFLGAMLLLLAVFWAGFTHLQSRFFILAIPICALLIARLPWFVGVVIALQAFIVFSMLNREFRPKMLAIAVGVEDYDWAMPPAMDRVPKDAPLALVGEARAFFYQRPMSILNYRTIFDADTSNGRSIVETWAGEKPKAATQWLLIDPNELRRFEKTYQPFPTLPADIQAHPESYIVER
jgi:hypothetical protein